jgi:hypothetical protein
MSRTNFSRNVPCFTPMSKGLILTHIFEKDLDKWLDKAEVLLIAPIRVTLPGSFAKWICQMWVRIRSKGRGTHMAQIER